MSISTAPPPGPPKKKGMGCLGCGCLVLALLAILLLGLVAGIGYFGFVSLASTTPAAVPTSNASDDVYNATKQKLADFDHDVKNHQAATIRLSADEINTMIAHDPNASKLNFKAFVTLTNDEARIQASLPADGLSRGLIKDRYFNLDFSFGVNFDPQTKSFNLTPHALQFGDDVLLGPKSSASTEASMRSFTPAFNQSFNNGIRGNPDAAALLDQAKSIEIKDGELVIETQ